MQGAPGETQFRSSQCFRPHNLQLVLCTQSSCIHSGNLVQSWFETNLECRSLNWWQRGRVVVVVMATSCCCRCSVPQHHSQGVARYAQLYNDSCVPWGERIACMTYRILSWLLFNSCCCFYLFFVDDDDELMLNVLRCQLTY